MPECTDRSDQLMHDVHDELDAEARKGWENHLSSCAVCRREREKLSAMLQGVKQTMAPPPLSMPDATAMVRGVHGRLSRFRLPRGWRQWLLSKWRPWLPALATACVLAFVATFVGYQRYGVTVGPVAEQVDNLPVLAEDDQEIINNLDLLKNFNTLEKLSQVVDESGGQHPYETNDQGTQGYIRHGQKKRMV